MDKAIPQAFFVYDWSIHEVDPLTTRTTDDDDNDDEGDSPRIPQKMPLTLVGYTIPSVAMASEKDQGRKHAIARLSVHGFMPHFYISLPSWVTKQYLAVNDCMNIKTIQKRIIEMMKYHEPLMCRRTNNGDRCPRCWVGAIHFVQRGRLYYGHTQEQQTPGGKWWYIRVRFQTQAERRRARYQIDKKKLYLPPWRASSGTENTTQWVCRVFEAEASPVLQMTTQMQLPTVGWVRFREGVRLKSPRLIHGNWEWVCGVDDIVPYREREDIPRPIVLSFDIEVYSADKNRMPNAENTSDEVFQIGLSVTSSESESTKILLQSCPIGLHTRFQKAWDNSKGILILCKDEESLLIRFREFILQYNPHAISGYNIFGFDFPYILKRCDMYDISTTFLKLGPFRIQAPVKEVAWSSAAYRNQHFIFPHTEGVICIDLLPLIRRDFKLSNYKLKTVSSFFLGDTKDPLTPQDLFRAYDAMRSPLGCIDGMIEAGYYCIQDADLVLRLFHHLQTWVGLCEMARISQVSLWSLYTQGQQIKVFSQIYRLCQEKNYVVDPPSEPDVLPYTGATVFPPQPGIYSWVVPFDFSSLYPTTIIAYNIDYSTYIPENDVHRFHPDSYHCIEWEEHTSCVHDNETYTPATQPTFTFCGKRKYCFLREPKGVIPELLESLLGARKETRKTLAGLPLGETLMREVLDKRQLAYKISANSMYGAMGVTKGYLPFMPGAMCTTAMGRQNIEKAASYVQSEYGAKLIYGDTDSIYVHFPEISNAKMLWEHACKIETDLLSLFPRPMKLAFEEKIYKKFLILTKKRYMALTCDQHDEVDKKLTIRGVLLARRDNCAWARKFYENVVRSLMASRTRQEIENELADGILDLFISKVPLHNLIITKLVGSDYVIPPLPTDAKKREKRLTDLGLQHNDPVQIPTRCMCGQSTGCRTTAGTALNSKPTGIAAAAAADNLEWIPAIERLFVGIFGSKGAPIKYSQQHRINSAEYIQMIREGTIAEWSDFTARHFYPDKPWQSPSWSNLNVNEGLLELVSRLAKEDHHVRDVPQSSNPKETLAQRGWDAVMIQVAREWVRKSLHLNSVQEIKISLPLTIEQVKKYVEKEKWNADIKHRRHCEKCACIGCLYNQRSLPAHVQLAKRMERRGTIVEAGTRLEYIVVHHPDDPKARLSEKLEDPVHYRRFPGVYRIDAFYYLHLLSFPMDQLLETCFRLPRMFSKLVEHHRCKFLCMKAVHGISSPEFTVLESTIPYSPIMRFSSTIIPTTKRRKPSKNKIEN